VWILENNRVRKAAVKAMGEPNDGLVAVTGDLTGGEQIVVDPPANLQEGEEVKTAE
jgi:hypothetical protein